MAAASTTDQSSNNQLHTVLEAAAAYAFPKTTEGAKKQRVVQQLLVHARSSAVCPTKVSLPLEAAAQAAGTTAMALLPLLREDSCFTLIAGPSSARPPRIELQYGALLSKARANTTTGTLADELPPAKGYTNGVHPLRPGQPACKHWVKFGECAFGERCVFHHPPGNKPPAGAAASGPPRSTGATSSQRDSVVSFRHAAKPASSASSSSSTQAVAALAQSGRPGAAAAAAAAAPLPSKPAWGSADASMRAVAPPGVQQVQAAGSSSQGSAPQPPPASAAPAAAAAPTAVVVVSTSNGASSSSSAPSTPGSMPANQAAQQAAAASDGAPQQQQQQLPPGFSTQHYQGRPCHMHMLRGFCPMGARCPYDHPARPGSATNQAAAPVLTAPAPAQQQQPGIAAGQQAVASPLAAAAQLAIPAAAAAVAQPPTPQASAAPAAAVTQRSWSELTGGTQSQQQQQQGSGGQGPATAAGSSADTGAPPAAAAAAAAGGGVDARTAGMPPERVARLLGWTDGNLPQFRGAPCCPVFMATGKCKFKSLCQFHHPAEPEHPEAFIATGALPRRFNVEKQRPSFARMTNYVYRLWDYDSCVEAQLKVWLAKHLLTINNKKTSMFDPSAAKPLQSWQFPWQVAGPYSCSAGEAGELLQRLWRAQPDDDAAKQPFPYRLEALLGDGDPFLECVPADEDAGSSSSSKSSKSSKSKSKNFFVRLNVEKIKAQLNF